MSSVVEEANGLRRNIFVSLIQLRAVTDALFRSLGGADPWVIEGRKILRVCDRSGWQGPMSIARLYRMSNELALYLEQLYNLEYVGSISGSSFRAVVAVALEIGRDAIEPFVSWHTSEGPLYGFLPGNTVPRGLSRW
jgi:mRNA-degrading endonuclease HigB of HigAB toxin-antitoxin module